LELAERGISVLLCEKGVVAGESSGRSFGLITNFLLSAVKNPLIARSKELWSAMNERVGADTGYRHDGYRYLFDTQAELDMAEAWLREANSWPGVDGRILDAGEARAMSPDTGIDWRGGLLMRSDSTAEPTLAVPAIAEAARRRGAVILQNTAVRTIERSAGRVSGVVTERGLVRTSTVIVAGGLWTPLILQSVGIKLTQLQYWSTMALTKPMAGPDIPGGNMTSFGVRKDPRTGGYYFGMPGGSAPITPDFLRNAAKLLPILDAAPRSGARPAVLNLEHFWRELCVPNRWRSGEISPFEKMRIFEPEASPDRVPLPKLRQWPAFAAAELQEQWGCAGSLMMDGMPVMSSIQSLPGLILGSGMAYGVTMGPGAGEALADIAENKTPRFDIAPYRYERFVDNTRLEFKL
jgi:glycine/D-amino acid oxidase-like deaminating enzyme